MSEEIRSHKADGYGKNTARRTKDGDESPINYAVVELHDETHEDEQPDSLVHGLPTSIDFEVMAFGGQATVCATAPKQGRRSIAFQSEADLEAAFIAQLQSQAYEYVTFSTEEQLVDNLRKQLELLNGFMFTDKEWQRFF